MQAGSTRGGVMQVARTASRHSARRARGPFNGSRVVRPFLGSASLPDSEMARAELVIEPLGAPAEHVVGDTLEVRVLFRGKAMSGGHVTVIPHGRTLPPYGTPNRWDLVTDDQGVARYEISEPGFHLVVAHIEARGDTAGRRESRSGERQAFPLPCAAALAVVVGAVHEQTWQ